MAIKAGVGASLKVDSSAEIVPFEGNAASHSSSFHNETSVILVFGE